MPKVSVVVPVYNVEKYLNKCINSIINQTLNDIEIILVDDGSTDSSGSICDEYAKQDSRIKVIHQENSYVGIARNNGISIACSKYVICLDSDDWFEPKMLETMYIRAEQTNADIVICRERGYLQKQGKYIKMSPYIDLYSELKTKDVFCGDDIPKYIFQFCVLWPWDKLYRRDFLLENKIEYPKNRIVQAAEDLVYVGDTLALAKRISYIEKKFITHRYHSSSLEANRAINVAQESLTLFKQHLEDRNLFKKYEQSYMNLALLILTWDYDISNIIRKWKIKKVIRNTAEFLKLNNYPENYFYKYGTFKKYLKIYDLKQYISKKISILLYLCKI